MIAIEQAVESAIVALIKRELGDIDIPVLKAEDTLETDSVTAIVVTAKSSGYFVYDPRGADYSTTTVNVDVVYTSFAPTESADFSSESIVLAIIDNAINAGDAADVDFSAFSEFITLPQNPSTNTTIATDGKRTTTRVYRIAAAPSTPSN